MRSILVIDDMAVFREPISASLRLAGYATFCAADGEEGLRIARSNHPDLILLDVSMPKMDGLTFLKHLRADASLAKTPVILLTALAEKKYILAAASLGVKDYLLKSRFRLQDLLERVKKFEPSVAAAPLPGVRQDASPAACPGPVQANETPVISARAPAAASSIPKLLSREQFLERLDQVFQAKTLSGVTAQVIAMAGSPRSEMKELANVIARDPMLSARVLQAANSASYAAAGSVVTTIPAAIRKIGCTTVRNIAAATGVFDCMPEPGPDGFNPIRCWQHSFAVAQLCERLASTQLPEQAGIAYVVGLCHDLGDILIRTQFSKEYQQVTQVAAQTGQNRDQVHGKMLGMTPSQMVEAVLRRVGLPEVICAPIMMMHVLSAERCIDPLAKILWMAENFANAALLASSPDSEVMPLTRAFCAAAAGNQDPPRPDADALRAEIQGLTAALARLSRGDEEKLLVPMFQPGQARVWIARHKTVSEFDPIKQALESLAEVKVHNRLPQVREMQDFSGLVVVGPSTGGSGFADTELQRILAGDAAGAPAKSVIAISTDANTDGNEQPGAIQWRRTVTLSTLAELAASQPKRQAQAA